MREIWTDIVGPNPRYARGFFARLLAGGRMIWRAPAARHVARLRKALALTLKRDLVPQVARRWPPSPI